MRHGVLARPAETEGRAGRNGDRAGTREAKVGALWLLEPDGEGGMRTADGSVQTRRLREARGGATRLSRARAAAGVADRLRGGKGDATSMSDIALDTGKPAVDSRQGCRMRVLPAQGSRRPIPIPPPRCAQIVRFPEPVANARTSLAHPAKASANGLPTRTNLPFMVGWPRSCDASRLPGQTRCPIDAKPDPNGHVSNVIPFPKR